MNSFSNNEEDIPEIEEEKIRIQSLVPDSFGNKVIIILNKD